MGNCFGSEEAEVEAVKQGGVQGHEHGHGRPQAIASRGAPPMAAPKAHVAAGGRRSPASSSMSSVTTRSTSASTSAGGGAQEGAEPEGRILEAPNLRIFTFAELRAATRNFKPDTLLGEGGFGQVYKGWVDEKTMNPARSGTGMVIAVKKLNQESLQGLEEWQVRTHAPLHLPPAQPHPSPLKPAGSLARSREVKERRARDPAVHFLDNPAQKWREDMPLKLARAYKMGFFLNGYKIGYRHQ